jgi:hypothetical protein
MNRESEASMPPVQYVQQQAVFFQPKVTPGRVKGTVSDYREALITLTREDLRLEGRAVLPQETQIPLMLAGLVVGVGPILVALLLEYAVRQPRSDYFRWDDIEEVVLEPGKQRACLVYRHPKRPNKFASLAFRLGEDYENFASAARQRVPEKVREGKIGSAISPIFWIWMGLIVAMIIFGLIMASSGSPRPPE